MDGLENQTTNFSDVPSLDDTAGLNAYLEQEQMAAQGIQPQPTPAAAPATGEPTTGTPASTVSDQPATGAPVTGTPAGTPNAGGLNLKGLDQGGLTQEQLAQIMTNLQSINQKLGNQPAQGTPNTPQTGYTDQERAFINAALARGYSLDRIQATIMQRRGAAVPNANANAAMEQRMANLENYLRSQEYKAAETAFVDRLSTFGNKFGLSEQDLVTFGNAALSKGINIAMPNVDLETVFRAVYPEQYRIRMQRMSPTNASQIYGGTSIPEGNRAAASRMEDAYVEQFMKQAMPNYGNKR